MAEAGSYRINYDGYIVLRNVNHHSLQPSRLSASSLAPGSGLAWEGGGDGLRPIGGMLASRLAFGKQCGTGGKRSPGHYWDTGESSR